MMPNGIMEESIDSIASKAAKYGLEKPVQIILKNYYEKKLKGKFSENYFKLLIYPSKTVVVQCPVDVYVYDAQNNLAGSIVDDQVTLNHSGIALWTEGDDKYIQLFDEGYRLVYKATGTGTMKVDIYDQMLNNQNYRNCELVSIPLEEGKEYTQQINNILMTDPGNYVLNGQDGEAYTINREQNMYTDEYPRHVHIWDKGRVTKKATCMQKGEKTYTCTTCEETKTESENMTGHSFGAWKITQAATALKQGTRTKRCSVCGRTESEKIPKLKASIKINVTGIPLKVKQSTNAVKVTGLAKGDYVKSWSSSNTKIASVDRKGRITAKSRTGRAIITVTLASGLKKQIKVSVQKSAVKTKKLTGLQSKMVLKKGKSITLKPVRYPITSTEKITYETSNKKVVIVNSKGKIKAVAPGKANITVKCGKAKFVIKVGVPRTKTTAISVAKSIKVTSIREQVPRLKQSRGTCPYINE